MGIQLPVLFIPWTLENHDCIHNEIAMQGDKWHLKNQGNTFFHMYLSTLWETWKTVEFCVLRLLYLGHNGFQSSDFCSCETNGDLCFKCSLSNQESSLIRKTLISRVVNFACLTPFTVLSHVTFKPDRSFQNTVISGTEVSSV